MQNFRNQYKDVIAITSIFALRMMGLFMLLPIFSIYADELSGANHTLLGLGLGIYGLTQALFQIPLGHLSDKFGRKKIITFGLSLFIIGSLVCAQATTITTLIIGRALQGAGAIGSTLIAFIADVTDKSIRTKSMAILGMVIGLSFTVSIVVGPLLARLLGFSSVFYIMALLGFMGILVTLFVVTSPNTASAHPEISPSLALFSVVIKNKKLMYLNAAIFFQHLIFTATFYVIPTLLEQYLNSYWQFYLPIMIASFVFAVPLIVLGEKRQKVNAIFMIAILVTLVAQLGLAKLPTSLWVLGTCLFIYFAAFNALEAMLPSSVTKEVAPEAKGTAMGLYSMSQFLGIFIGGLIAGQVAHYFSPPAVFYSSSVLAIFWLMLTYGLSKKG